MPWSCRATAFAWFDVLSVTERKQKPFEEVKDEVKTVYIDKEKTTAAQRSGAEAGRAP